MGLFGFLLALLLAIGLSERSLESRPEPSASAYLLYLAQQGELGKAIQGYRERIRREEKHDFEWLRHLGRIILRQGQLARSDAGKVLALYGAGIAQDADLTDLIRHALFSANPEAQLIAIDLLDKQHTDQANDLLMAAMSSEFLLPRFEAAFRLVEKGYLPVIDQLQSLLVKITPELHPIFCDLFARAASPESDRILRQLMASGSTQVQQAAALSLGRLGRDDFLPEIRRLVHRIDPLQQEAAAVAIGQLRDTDSLERMRELTLSAEQHVQVAAWNTLYALGDETAYGPLVALARGGELFAITCLGHLSQSQEVLAKLTNHADPQIRLNAAISLLKHRDNRCLAPLIEVLVPGPIDRGVLPRISAGGGLMCFEYAPSIDAKSRNEPELKELSNTIREKLLMEALELDEHSFLTLARAIFEAKQNELVPLLTSLLENKATPGAIRLLERECERVGAPLIRSYCHLALFRHDPSSVHAQALRDWVKRQSTHPLLQLRPVLPWTKRRTQREEFALNPEETSRLLVESYEALAQQRDLAAIDALLDGIEHGHPDNRYVLAALLMRAAE